MQIRILPTKRECKKDSRMEMRVKQIVEIHWNQHPMREK